MQVANAILWTLLGVKVVYRSGYMLSAEQSPERSAFSLSRLIMLAQPHPRAPDGFKSPYDAMEDDTDAATARLVADLLAQDMEAAANFHAAEQMQLQLLLDDSRPGSPASGPAEMVYESNDRVEALRLALDTATASAVEKEQLASTADSNWARQLGQQFEAQRRKAMVPTSTLLLLEMLSRCSGEVV